MVKYNKIIFIKLVQNVIEYIYANDGKKKNLQLKNRYILLLLLK